MEVEVEVENMTWAWLRVCYWEPARLVTVVVVFRAIACVSVTLLSVSMGRNVRVVDEVNGSPLQMMDLNVINQCEVKLTAREATTMTLCGVLSAGRSPYRVTAVS